MTKKVMNFATSIQLTIIFKGDLLKPSILTEKIGTAPTKSHEKGKRWITSSGAEVVEKTGLWRLSMRDDVGAGLSSLVKSLGAAVSGRCEQLNQLPGVDSACLDVLVMIPADEDGGGTCEFALDKDSVFVLEEIGLPINFTSAVIVP
jgi:hypothetical protein